MSKSNRHSLIAFASTLYIAICLWVPGGVTHINLMATSFALIATLLIICSLTPGVLSRNAVIAAVLAGGFFAAAAISMRPYFLAPLVVTTVWSAFYPLRSEQSIGRRNLIVFLCLGGTIGAWGLTLNLLPYIIVGRVDAFVAGLQMLRQNLNPLTFLFGLSETNSTAPSFILSSFVLISALLALGYKSGNRTAPFLLIIIASVAALIAFVAQKHWWAHYILFFCGYFSLALLFFIAWIFEDKLRFRILITTVASGLIVVLAGGILYSSVKSIKTAVERRNFSHVNADTLASFQDYRSQGDHSELAFLAPDHMYLHWQLHEPRHGFPHSANTSQIFKGWWKNIKPSSVFQTPKNKKEYCDLLMAEGPEIVVTASNARVAPCFQAIATPYHVDAEYPIGRTKDTLLIFRRK